MRVTKRKDEIARLVALLESDRYETAEDLALAVFQESVDLIAARHLFVVVARQYPEVSWGPYATAAEAARAWLKEIGPAIGTAGGVVLPVAPWDSTVDQAPEAREHPTTLCTCGHPKWHHLDTHKGRSSTARTTRCNSPREGCKCPAFTAK